MQTQERWMTDIVENNATFFTKPLSVPQRRRGIFEKLVWVVTDIWRNYRPTEPYKKESYLRQMYYLAYADQYLSEKEKSYILDVGLQIQLEKDRIVELGYQSKNQSPHFVRLPRKNRFFYVFHLVNLIRMSEDVSDDAICRAQFILMKQGYAPDTVDIILATIEQNEKAGASYHQTYNQLKETLG